MDNTLKIINEDRYEIAFAEWLRTRSRNELPKLLAITALLEVPPASNKYSGADFTDAIRILEEMRNENTAPEIEKAIKWLHEKRNTTTLAA